MHLYACHIDFLIAFLILCIIRGITLSYANAMKAIRRYWEERAQAYSERREKAEWKMEVDQRVAVLLNVKADHMVLEIGVGPGLSAIHLAKERQPTIVGLDFAKRFLNIAKDKVKKANVSDQIFLILGSADFLPLRSSSFNAAFCVHTIHHLPPSGIKEAFLETHRVLKDEGRFALVENWGYEPKNEFQRIMLELRRLLMTFELEEWHLKYSEYIAMLKKAGLKTFNVQFVPREIHLSRFERIPNEKAKKLLQKAKRFEEKERFVDAAIISSVKSKRKLGKQP